MKFQDLQKQLIELILSRSSLQGDRRFFSERDICEMFNVSRTTARKAISALCEQGYLLKEQGRGTFIKTPAQSMPLSTVLHLSKSYIENGYHPKIDVLQKKIVTATITYEQAKTAIQKIIPNATFKMNCKSNYIYEFYFYLELDTTTPSTSSRFSNTCTSAQLVFK